MFSEKFTIGCNYWASDVGINMWSEYNPEIIKKDMEALSKNGINVIRVFPLWSVFQPIDNVLRYGGEFEGYSDNGGKTILYDVDESAGINPVAIEHFSSFLDITEQYGIKVMPALITGWMSGRLFAPRSVLDKNLLTDPIAIMWEVRFCRYFVNKFKDRKNIIAWGLGNESNCCGKVATKEEGWLWTAMIANAIRSCDPSRPVISGMHGLGIRGEGNWEIMAQGENCDIVTTHPYASPTYNTDNIPATNFKAVLMPSCQTKLYRNLSKKPCIIEETGTFGEMYVDDETTAIFSRNCILNAWAQGCLGYFWWIGFDQGHLEYHPFGYNNRASNYGLLRKNWEEKPILREIKKFNKFLDNFEYKTLPAAHVDGICLLSPGVNSWAVASSTYYLAQQADINLEFSYIEDNIPDSNLYFLPSIVGCSIGVSALNRLMEKVSNGAVLYVSASEGILRNMSKDFGFHIKNRIELDSSNDTCTFNNSEEDFKLNLPFTRKFNIELTDAKAIGFASDSTPIFTCVNYGKGKIFYLGSAMERYLFGLHHGFEKNYHKIYSIVKSAAKIERLFSSKSTVVTLTEHIIDDNKRIVVAVNNSDKEVNIDISSVCNIKNTQLHYGKSVLAKENALSCSIESNDALVFEVTY